MIGDDKTCPHCCSIVALRTMVERRRYSSDDSIISLMMNVYFLGVVHGAASVMFDEHPDQSRSCDECAKYGANIALTMSNSFAKLRMQKDGN